MVLRILKWGILTMVLVGGAVLFFLNLGKFSNSSASAQGNKLPNTHKSSSELVVPIVAKNIGLPSRVAIPSLKVDAAVDLVGLLPDGSMGIPTIPSKVAWFKLGPRPGEVGSAAISGHVNWWNGATGVFAKLNKLKPGDKVLVKDDAGRIISFVVRQSRLYGSQADATDVFFSNDGLAHLNLITCGGVWNKRVKQYSQRLVVFTDKE